MNGKQMLILVEYLQFPKSKDKSLAQKKLNHVIFGSRPTWIKIECVDDIF